MLPAELLEQELLGFLFPHDTCMLVMASKRFLALPSFAKKGKQRAEQVLFVSAGLGQLSIVREVLTWRFVRFAESIKISPEVVRAAVSSGDVEVLNAVSPGIWPLALFEDFVSLGQSIARIQPDIQKIIAMVLSLSNFERQTKPFASFASISLLEGLLSSGRFDIIQTLRDVLFEGMSMTDRFILRPRLLRAAAFSVCLLNETDAINLLGSEDLEFIRSRLVGSESFRFALAKSGSADAINFFYQRFEKVDFRSELRFREFVQFRVKPSSFEFLKLASFTLEGLIMLMTSCIEAGY